MFVRHVHTRGRFDFEKHVQNTTPGDTLDVAVLERDTHVYTHVYTHIYTHVYIHVYAHLSTCV